MENATPSDMTSKILLVTPEQIDALERGEALLSTPLPIREEGREGETFHAAKDKHQRMIETTSTWIDRCTVQLVKK